MSMEHNSHSPLNVAFIGSGKIGVDLLIKCLNSPLFNCKLVAGRNFDSPGMIESKNLGVDTSDQGINAVMEMKDEIDLVFDATSALAHIEHWKSLQTTDIRVVDMTPSKIGKAVVPVVNLSDFETNQNINMISCGGQSSIPLAHAVGSAVPNVEYVEVVSSIASKSAGLATRINLDEYIHTTEQGLKDFSGTASSKVILILNPAEPPVNMQTTVSVLAKDPDMDLIEKKVKERVAEIQAYVPGYELVVNPKLIDDNRIVMMVKVVGAGDYLPAYAGNLDIINCAAVAAAEHFAKSRESVAALSLPKNSNKEAVLR